MTFSTEGSARLHRTLPRHPTADPLCPDCGLPWSCATTFAGDHVTHENPAPSRAGVDSLRWWTLHPCEHRVSLRLGSLDPGRPLTPDELGDLPADLRS